MKMTSGAVSQKTGRGLTKPPPGGVLECLLPAMWTSEGAKTAKNFVDEDDQNPASTPIMAAIPVLLDEAEEFRTARKSRKTQVKIRSNIGVAVKPLREMLLEELVGVHPPTRFRADPLIKIISLRCGTHLK